VLGLALFEEEGTRAPLLGYLLFHERDEYEIPKEYRKRPRPRFDRREALAWEPFGDLSIMIGRAPLVGSPTLQAGVSIPAPLRAFYDVHAGWSRQMWRLSSPDELLLWHQMLEVDPATLVQAETADDEPRPDPDQVRRADALLYFFSYGDDCSDLFDLAAKHADPPVRAWGDGFLYRGADANFRKWLEGNIALFVGSADESGEDEDD
jgi:hypothetical protein